MKEEVVTGGAAVTSCAEQQCIEGKEGTEQEKGEKERDEERLLSCAPSCAPSSPAAADVVNGPFSEGHVNGMAGIGTLGSFDGHDTVSISSMTLGVPLSEK